MEKEPALPRQERVGLGYAPVGKIKSGGLFDLITGKLFSSVIIS